MHSEMLMNSRKGKKAKDTKEIFMPGEIELRKEIKALEGSLEIEDDTFKPLVDLAEKYNVELDFDHE